VIEKGGGGEGGSGVYWKGNEKSGVIDEWRSLEEERGWLIPFSIQGFR